MSFKYVKRVEGNPSTYARVDNKPIFGKESATSEYFIDGNWYDSSGVLLPPQSYLENPDGTLARFEIINGDLVAVDKGEIVPSLVLPLITQTENVKIVDFGTVVNNNRYVVDNPFGNENYEGCTVRAEVFTEGIWSDTGWGDDNNVNATGYGTRAFSNLEGLVIQTGAAGVLFGKSAGTGSGFDTDTSTVYTSLQCRVVVTFNGKAKNA